MQAIKTEFEHLGENKISGNEVLKIVNEIIIKLTIPKEVELAQKFISECHKDLGFMGSPEYYRQKKIVDDYYLPIKLKEEKEKELYKYLKNKYGGL